VASTSPSADPPSHREEPPASSFDHWLQDFDEACRRAKDEHKDVLLLFDASDWSHFSESLADEVLTRPASWEQLTKGFVPVHIDFPQRPRAKRRVQDAGRNAALEARFFKNPAYPTIVLTDAEARPYGIEWGYKQGEPQSFLANLREHRSRREKRDALLETVARSEGQEKLEAAEAALDYLARKIEGPTSRGDGTYVLSLTEFYAPLLKQWRGLADALDPQNSDGYRERFFFADWTRRWRKVMNDGGATPEALRAMAVEFDTWRAQCRFNDSNYAADLLDSQARLVLRLGDTPWARREVDVALGLKDLSPAWREAFLRLLPQAKTRLGTGFAVASGYLVTSFHVVQGPGPVRVRVQGQEPVECTVVGYDEGSDLALLKVVLPPQVALRPLRVAPQATVGRGTEVMALGYALGGETLKFTHGAISARQEGPGRSPLLLLDQRVNPGNSGGPLCDACGNIVGIVAAKTFANTEVDSFGIAVDAGALDRFLSKSLKPKEYQASPPLQRKIEWGALDRWVSPSVVLVIKRSL
jgi:S1-C subfamily serine protease